MNSHHKMTSLGDIEPEPLRKSYYNAAVAAEPSPEQQAAAQQLSIDEQYTRVIRHWVSVTDTNPCCKESSTVVREALVTPAVADGWEVDLLAAGYEVTRADGLFTVALRGHHGAECR